MHAQQHAFIFFNYYYYLSHSGFPLGFCLLSSLKLFYLLFYLLYCYLAIFKTFFFFTVKCTSSKVNSFNCLRMYISVALIPHIVVQSPLPIPRTFSSSQTKTPCPLNNNSHLPPLLPPSNRLFYFPRYELDYLGSFLPVKLHSDCPSASGFIHFVVMS